MAEKKAAEKSISVPQHVAEVAQIKSLAFDEMVVANQSLRAVQKNEQAQRQLLQHICEALECDLAQLMPSIEALKTAANKAIKKPAK